jgi:negative regulator of flagellin synthesis FlgM
LGEALNRLLGLQPTRLLKFSERVPLKGPWTTGVLDVTTKIDGLQNRPVQLGTDKKVSSTSDATATPAKAQVAESSPVQITSQARQLAALEKAVNEVPVVNEARVAAIRSAIEQGQYEVNADRVADKLLRTERELSA